MKKIEAKFLNNSINKHNNMNLPFSEELMNHFNVKTRP